tara:strand:+ start:7068 stop:7937 length:870 start_codon:yes stop_codon:yes gene_type:complete
LPIETLAIISGFCYSVSAILTRLGLDKSTSQTGSFVVAATYLVITTLALPLDQMPLSSLSMNDAYFLAAGISSPALSLLFLYRSINFIGVAPTTAIVNTNALFGSFLAFFILQERPSELFWLGLVIVLSGIFLISEGLDKMKGRYKYLLLPLLSAVCFGLSHTFRKLGFENSQSSFLTGAFLQGLSACIFMPLILKVGSNKKNKTYVFNLKSLKFFIPAGVAVVFGQFLILHVIKFGQVSLVSSILATNPLFSLILTHIFLQKKEKLTLKIILGVITIVSGVVILTLSK